MRPFFSTKSVLSQSPSDKGGTRKIRIQQITSFGSTTDKPHMPGLEASLGFGPLCFESSEPGRAGTVDITMVFQSPSDYLLRPHMLPLKLCLALKPWEPELATDTEGKQLAVFHCGPWDSLN